MGDEVDTDTPERREVDRVARLLMATWSEVDGPIGVSFFATFADMARAVIADNQAARAEERRAITQIPDSEPTGWDAEQWRANAAYWYGRAQEALGFRDLAALQAEQQTARAEAAEARLAEVEEAHGTAVIDLYAANARLAEVRALHFETKRHFCAHCMVPYPCPTIAVLDAVQDTDAPTKEGRA